MPADVGHATAEAEVEVRRPSTTVAPDRVASVVTIGFGAGTFVPGSAPVASFVGQPGRDDVGALMDSVQSGLEATGHVVAIYPRWDPEPALRRLETVGAALDTASLAVYATPLPPLAGAVLASLASAAAAHVGSPGVLHGGLARLERELLICAWLASVAGLSTPSPTLAQHLLSVLPTSSFGVTVQPEGSVRTLTKKDRSIPLPTTHRPMCLAVASREPAGASWIDEVVAPALGSPPVKRVDPTPNGPKWWGTPRVTEAVAYPIDIPVVARRMTQGLEAGLCRWCRRVTASPQCPFCGLDATADGPVGGVS